MITMKKWDILLGVTGFTGTLTLKDWVGLTVGVLTCVLLALRIYVTWKHRNRPPMDD